MPQEAELTEVDNRLRNTTGAGPAVAMQDGRPANEESCCLLFVAAVVARVCVSRASSWGC